MPAVNEVTDLSRHDDVALITLHSPPVNALSAPVRAGLTEAFRRAIADEDAKAIVLICAGRTFIAGADISELDSGGKIEGIEDLQTAMERAGKPVVAAIHGTALGGGLEVALCAHFRIAASSARLGLPEVNLGLLPGGGGTQRLPRVVGVAKALEMVTSGRHVSAGEALEIGLVDKIVPDTELRTAALDFALEMAGSGQALPVVRDRDEKILEAREDPQMFDEFRKSLTRDYRGFKAPEANVRCIEAAVALPFDEGLKAERAIFIEVLTGEQSAAQRYAFFAERAAGKIPGLGKNIAHTPIKRVGLLSFGRLGEFITAELEAAGFPVAVVQGGSKSADNAPSSAGSEPPAFEPLGDCDLVIATFENLSQARADLIAALEAALKPGAIFAIAGAGLEEALRASAASERVVGFYLRPVWERSQLLGVVRTDETSAEALSAIFEFGRTIGKVCVVAKPAPGFFGDRMFAALLREAQALVREGATPEDVDRALFDFGFPRGPFDEADPNLIADLPSEREQAARIISSEEMLNRCIDAVANEAAEILDEQKVIRASDIDVAWIHGYGWPAYRGGPLYHAGEAKPDGPHSPAIAAARKK
jgi:3-hydroxyacyl-CoA dehydrogenase